MSHADPTDVFVTGGTYRHRLGDPTILLDGVAWDLTAAVVTIKWVGPDGTAYGPYTCETVDDADLWHAYWDNPDDFFTTAGSWIYEFTITQGDIVQKTARYHLDVTAGL